MNLALKNNTSKIMAIHSKKHCFGLRRLQDEATMYPTNTLFGVLKSYEFIVKNRVTFTGLDPKTKQFLKGFILFKKHVLSQPMVLSQRELDL